MLDVKDYKILYELSLDSRLSAPKIAKKVGLSKDAVIYRIKNLEKESIIQKFITVVDLKKLNYRTHIIFLEFRKFNTETEKVIISWLVNLPYTIWVASAGEKWDLIIDLISKDSTQLDKNLNEILNKIGANLKSYEVLETILEYYYNHKYLTNQKLEQVKKSKSTKYTLDKIDYSILKELSQNTRKASTEIAKSLGISHDIVTYRIKKLKQSQYIHQFTLLIDFSKLNLSYHYIFLQFSNLTQEKENKLTTFLKLQKEVLFFSKTVGKYNFNIDMIVKTTQELRKFMIQLKNLFGDIIESKENFIMFEQYKNNYFPEGIPKDIEENQK